MKRCVKCIMPDTAKGIVIDHDGCCQLCRNYQAVAPKGVEALREEILPYLETDAEYNCLVPLSGGRDSTYALYYVKKVLNLKPIAVNNDNDFQTEVATQNLAVTTSRLEVPLVRIRSKNQISKKIVRDKVVMNAPFGPGLVVDQICEACKYGFEQATYNLARQKNIKVIFWGDSLEESTKNFHDLSEHENPMWWQRIFSPGSFSFLKYKYHFAQMKREYGKNPTAGLKEIHLYDYIRWDRKVIVETIKREAGWTVPDDFVTTWRTDCSLVPIVNYLTGKAYGVTKLELGFSNMIRTGKMEREEALKQIEMIENSITIEDLKAMLKKIGIREATINDLF